jgi:hypothetical protein
VCSGFGGGGTGCLPDGSHVRGGGRSNFASGCCNRIRAYKSFDANESCFRTERTSFRASKRFCMVSVRTGPSESFASWTHFRIKTVALAWRSDSVHAKLHASGVQSCSIDAIKTLILYTLRSSDSYGGRENQTARMDSTAKDGGGTCFEDLQFDDENQG